MGYRLHDDPYVRNDFGGELLCSTAALFSQNVQINAANRHMD